MIQLANWKFGYKLANKVLPSRTISICLEDSKNRTLLPTHQYNTRNKFTPNLPTKANKDYRESFLLKGPRSVLTLEQEIQKSPNLSIFTSRCKQILINKYEIN